MEVNVFQWGCDVVVQKSIREGFGLVVSEALWKAKPVSCRKSRRDTDPVSRGIRSFPHKRR
jgi:hypothetical protein